MLIRERELRRLIRKSFLLRERNFKKHFKKPFDYDLVIFDHLKEEKKAHPVNIFLYFKKEENDLWDNVLDIKSNKSIFNNSIDKDFSTEDIKRSLSDAKLSILELKKSKEVIKVLKDKFDFNFSNCNLSDDNPILCVPAVLGDDVNIRKDYNDQVKQVFTQSFESNEDMNWLIHDEHHHDAGTSSGGEELFMFDNISSDIKPYTDDFRIYTEAMLSFFIKIGFTKGIRSSNHWDVWPSIYSYCLTSMKSKKDANKIDFTKIENTLNYNHTKGEYESYTKEESQKIQMFLSNCYETVHKNSKLSRSKVSILDKIKNKVFKKKINKKVGRKLKDGSIYIYYITS